MSKQQSTKEEVLTEKIEKNEEELEALEKNFARLNCEEQRDKDAREIEDNEVQELSEVVKNLKLETVLLVGEGDFSFAKKYSKKHRGAIIYATELRTEEELAIYPKFKSNLEKLQSAKNVKVLFGVDGTKLHEHEILKNLKFDSIIWNAPFPDVRGGFGYLFKDFFASSSKVQESGQKIYLRLTLNEKYRPRYEIKEWEEKVKEEYTMEISEQDSLVKYKHVFNTKTPSNITEWELRIYTKK